MITKLLIILIIIPLAAMFYSIVLQSVFNKVTTLKHLYNNVLSGFQKIFIFLESDRIICIAKISRNKFITNATFPTTVIY